MAQPTVLENLEEIMRSDAAFPFDAIITEIFTNTVNVKQVGSRTIVRNVALPDHIKAEDLEIGYPVRLGKSGASVIVTAFFAQFADQENFNYAGLGSRMPGKAVVSAKANGSAGWVITWPKVTNATRYIIYQNDTDGGLSPELVQTIPVTNLAQANYSLNLAYDFPFRYFAVQACNGQLEGDVSLWATDSTPPTAPTWPATGSHNFLVSGHQLIWNHSYAFDVWRFTLYRNTSPIDAGATLVGTTDNAHLFTTAAYGVGNYFGVKSTDWTQVNSSAIVWNLVLYSPTPAVPVPTAQMFQIGGFTVTWPATAITLNYEVQGATDGAGTGAALKYSGPNLSSGNIVQAGITFFRVRAQGYDLSYSAWSGWVTDTVAPPIPLLTNQGGISQVIINLAVADTSHNSVGFSHYVMQVSNSSSGTSPTTLDTHALYGSFPRIIDQITGITKYYRLTPYDWAGNAGTPSAWTAATPSTAGATLQDKFDRYGGSDGVVADQLYWLRISRAETPESWIGYPTGATVETALIKDGPQARRCNMTPTYALCYLQMNTYMYGSPYVSLDLDRAGRFGPGDYVTGWIYISNPSNIQSMELSFNCSGVGSASWFIQGQMTQTGWNHFKVKRSGFHGGSDLHDVSQIIVSMNRLTTTGTDYFIVDDIRIVKADPDISTAYNDTGRAWDYTASTGTDYGEWHIYEGNRISEPKKPFSLGQGKVAASPSIWQMAVRAGVTITTPGTIQIGLFHKENGKSGLAFFIKDTTPGSWDMYAVEVDNVGDTVKLVKWVAGVRTELGSNTFAFISAGGGTVGQTIWVGVDFTEFDTDAGRLRVYVSATEANLIQTGNNNLRISVQDTSIGSGGLVGLLSNQANVRFVNLVAGSPAHADVADVALGLDGPIIAGETRRVRYNATTNVFEYTDDDVAFVVVGNTIDTFPVSKLWESDAGAVAFSADASGNMASAAGKTITAARLISNVAVGTAPFGATSTTVVPNLNADMVDGSHATAFAGAAHAHFGNGGLSGLLAATLIRGTNQTLTTGLWGTVTFGAYYQNTLNGWDGATALYAPTAGWYWLWGNVNFATASSATQRGLRFIGNTISGTVGDVVYVNGGMAAAGCWISIAMPYYFNANDYVQLQAFQNTGGNLDITANQIFMGFVRL